MLGLGADRGADRQGRNGGSPMRAPQPVWKAKEPQGRQIWVVPHTPLQSPSQPDGNVRPCIRAGRRVPNSTSPHIQARQLGQAAIARTKGRAWLEGPMRETGPTCTMRKDSTLFLSEGWKARKCESLKLTAYGGSLGRSSQPRQEVLGRQHHTATPCMGARAHEDWAAPDPPPRLTGWHF